MPNVAHEAPSYNLGPCPSCGSWTTGSSDKWDWKEPGDKRQHRLCRCGHEWFTAPRSIDALALDAERTTPATEAA